MQKSSDLVIKLKARHLFTIIFVVSSSGSLDFSCLLLSLFRHVFCYLNTNLKAIRSFKVITIFLIIKVAISNRRY